MGNYAQIKTPAWRIPKKMLDLLAFPHLRQRLINPTLQSRYILWKQLPWQQAYSQQLPAQYEYQVDLPGHKWVMSRFSGYLSFFARPFVGIHWWTSIINPFLNSAAVSRCVCVCVCVCASEKYFIAIYFSWFLSGHNHNELWTLTKKLEKTLDSNYTIKLRAIMNSSWRQHPTKQQLYSHLPPITKTIQIDEPDMQDSAGEVGMSSLVMCSYRPLHIAERKLVDQHEPTYSSSVRIRVVALRTSRKRWTIGRGGERGSGISVLMARQDDDGNLQFGISSLIIYHQMKQNSEDILFRGHKTQA